MERNEQQFLEEQSGLDRADLPHLVENLRSHDIHVLLMSISYNFIGIKQLHPSTPGSSNRTQYLS
jgi:hypothetical protein